MRLFRVAIAAVFFAGLNSIDLNGADDVSITISKNAQSLKSIKSYHVKMITSGSLTISDKVVSPLEPHGITEVWSEGLRRRHLQRTLKTQGPAGLKDSLRPHGDVSESSMNDKERRDLSGWDSEHPFKLPLEFGINAEEYSAVRGGIVPRDPQQPIADGDFSAFLWSVTPGKSLADLESKVKFVQLASPTEGLTRLQIASTDDPSLNPFAGTLIDIDVAHGSMIQRIEREQNGQKNTWEVTAFKEATAGIWVPEQVKITSLIPAANAQRLSVIEFETFDVNIPLTDSDLTVAFPEGARVIESPILKLHIWGKDGQPAHTFTTDEQLRDFNYARARELQGAGQLNPLDASGSLKKNWFIGVNVLLISLLFLLRFIRQKSSQK